MYLHSPHHVLLPFCEWHKGPSRRISTIAEFHLQAICSPHALDTISPFPHYGSVWKNLPSPGINLISLFTRLINEWHPWGVLSLSDSPPGTLRVLRALGITLLHTNFCKFLTWDKNCKVKAKKSYGWGSNTIFYWWPEEGNERMTGRDITKCTQG